ncbi:MAG TPA: PRC-barrel domain-containing protein [Woeseiaceae bacterium]|nr:PRC-barrel domain-containing protein [Woeseiaceae bacterium]
MKKQVAIAVGLALTGSMALAAQEQGTTQDYDPNRDIVTETERDRGTTMESPRQDSPVQSEYGTEPETQTESDMSTDPYGTDQSQSQTTDQYGTDQSQSQTDTTDTYGTQSETETTQQSASTWEDKSGKDIADMTADKLSGKSVVTADGEEIGDIDEVGYSATHQERVAVIEAGGFLGVGEKRVAVPLSELELGSDGNVKTTMDRDSIESQEEFDEAGFTADQTDQTRPMDDMNQ